MPQFPPVTITGDSEVAVVYALFLQVARIEGKLDAGDPNDCLLDPSVSRDWIAETLQFCREHLIGRVAGSP